MPHTLVTFHAHPDDESLLTAGVMAKAARDGHRVVNVVATDGGAGKAPREMRAPSGLGRRRLGELAAACRVLGVARIECLGYADSGSDRRAAGTARDAFSRVPARQPAARLAEILREESADVLTIYDENGGYGHPDHVQVHVVGALAAELAGTPVVLEATLDRDVVRRGLDLARSIGPALPPGALPSDADAARWFVPAQRLTTAVDVREVIAAKRAAIEAHASQTTGDGSSPSGMRNLGLFLALPQEHFELVFGTEWFIRRGAAPGIAEHDVFAALGRPA